MSSSAQREATSLRRQATAIRQQAEQMARSLEMRATALEHYAKLHPAKGTGITQPRRDPWVGLGIGKPKGNINV